MRDWVFESVLIFCLSFALSGCWFGGDNAGRFPGVGEEGCRVVIDFKVPGEEGEEAHYWVADIRPALQIEVNWSRGLVTRSGDQFYALQLLQHDAMGSDGRRGVQHDLLGRRWPGGELRPLLLGDLTAKHFSMEVTGVLGPLISIRLKHFNEAGDQSRYFVLKVPLSSKIPSSAWMDFEGLDFDDLQGDFNDSHSAEEQIEALDGEALRFGGFTRRGGEIVHRSLQPCCQAGEGLDGDSIKIEFSAPLTSAPKGLVKGFQWTAGGVLLAKNRCADVKIEGSLLVVRDHQLQVTHRLPLGEERHGAVLLGGYWISINDPFRVEGLPKPELNADGDL